MTKLVPILSYENYPEWSELMEAWLVRNGLWAPIEVEIRLVGGPLAKSVKDWIEREAKAKAEIKLYVGLEQLAHCRLPTAKAIWKNLEKLHQAKGFSTQLSLLWRFHTMRMDKLKPMLAWVSAVHNHAYHISTTGYTLHNTHVILVLMQGLPESYSHLTIALDATPAENLTLDYTIDHLLNEEARQETLYVTQREINSALSATQNKGKLG
jgi:hypothetical protein